MAKNLLIVESPNKVKKIKSFLDSDWDVIASVGHIRDLATFGTRFRLGLDLETMEPNYIELREKKEIIKELISQTNKAKNIYLATDPDREGESIAYHILKIITNNKANIKRITFNEITKESILKALDSPRDLNDDLIHSQEARRILDRIIGFRLSYLTNKKISAKSAGRVKSSVLKLIIDRENEIEKFVPKYWWTIEGQLSKEEFLINVDSVKFSEIKYESKEKALEVKGLLTGNFKFVDRKESKRTIKPPLPFEMATYLMAMYSNYGMANNSATYAIQSLYEKGLITYPRTDSKRISSVEFINSAKKYISLNYGKEFYQGLKEIKLGKNDQDAHEAIRPVDVSVLPSEIKGLKINEKKAYTLIWNNTVKSLMVEGQNKVVTDIYKDGENFFSYKRSYAIFPGFRLVDDFKVANEIEPEQKIKIDLNKINVVDHQTKPPSRYNQSSLIKLMKEIGIGRPSTYAGVTSGLIGFGYVEKVDKTLKPTPMAQEVNDLLQNSFSDIVHEKYTAEMETSLDKIANGKINSRKYLKDFWNEFEPRVEKADETIPVKPVTYTGRDCPICNEGKLIYKRGRFGEFIACDKFPNCKHAESLEPKKEPKESGELCPKCGKSLVVREAKKTKIKFIACSGFPRCTYIYPEERTIETLLNLGEITEEQKLERLKKLEKRKEKDKAKSNK